jgi:hypothetical protein
MRVIIKIMEFVKAIPEAVPLLTAPELNLGSQVILCFLMFAL